VRFFLVEICTGGMPVPQSFQESSKWQNDITKKTEIWRT
jgi:hypothetical protein